MGADEKDSEQTPSTPLANQPSDSLDTSAPVDTTDIDLPVDTDIDIPIHTDPPPLVMLAPGHRDEAFPLPSAPGSQPAPIDPRQAPAWQGLLAEYEREIEALGDVPEAAALYFECGRIWEEKLAQPRNAWICYNKAFQLRPRLLPNIRAARQLASQIGNWNATIQILESEAEATEDALGKAYLHLHRGLVLEEKLGRIDDACQAYQTALAFAPDNIECLQQIERLALLAGDWPKVVEIRKRLADLISDPHMVVALLLSSARILQVHLQDTAGAEALYRRILTIEAGQLSTLRELTQIYAASRRFEDQVEILEKELAVTTTTEEVAMLRYQIARVLRESLGNEEGAIQFLQQALQISPNNRLLLDEMACIYENLMRWPELVATLEQQVNVITDPQELVSVYFKLGTLLEEKLFDDDRAIPHYRKVIELDANHQPAHQALGKLFYRKGCWADLVKMYEIEIHELQDPKPKSVRLYKLAEILEERINRDEDAIARLEQCLELNQGYLPALKALGRLYAKYNRWEKLIRMYEDELAVTNDHEQAVFLLDKIGSLWEEKLGNLDQAIASYQRILEISPNHLPAIRTLGKLYIRADRWDETIKVNETEAQLVNDQKQVVSLLHRNGEIFEEKLNNKDMAIETYKKVLALAPAYLPALQSLGRLYFIKGRWEDLVAMYRQEIEVTQSESQHISLLYKIGELYEQKMIHEERAIQIYQEVLRIQPSNFPSLKALIRIYSNKRDWENLIEIYEKEALVLEDPAQRALSLYRIAETWEQQLGRPDKAVDTLQRILLAVEDYAPAIQALIQLYTRGGNWRELLSVYERQLRLTPSEDRQVEILSAMAEIFATQINDLVKAAEYHERILAINPEYLPALEALERIYLSQRNYEALVRVYENQSAHVNDPRLQIMLQSQIVDLKENRLQPPLNAGENVLKMLALNPAHPEANRALDLLYRKSGTWQGLRKLYESALGRTITAEELLDSCMRLGDLAESYLNDLEVATHYYREALRLAPEHLPAIKALKRIYLSQNKQAELLDLLDREGLATHVPQQAITILLQAAQIFHERLFDDQRAIGCLLRVLEHDPREEQAFQMLEVLLTGAADWERLVGLYSNRLRIAESHESIELYLKLGRLTNQRLQRPRDALGYLQEILKIDPNYLPAITALAELSFELGEWNEAIYFGLRVLELGADNNLAAITHYRLGVIFQEKQPQPENAIEHFRQVLTLLPDDINSLQRLKTIHFARQQWAETIGVLARLNELEHDPQRQVANYYEQASIFERGLGDFARAVQCYQKVQVLAPNNLEVFNKLSQLYERLEQWEELIGVYQAFIQKLPEDRAPDVVSLHLKIGKIYSEKLNNLDKAILEYQRITVLDPSSVDAHLYLSRLYGSNELHYTNAVEEHRVLLKLDPYRIDSYRELRKIFEKQRAYDKVFCVCSVLHFLRVTDPDEELFYTENYNKVAEQSSEQIPHVDYERLLLHPDEYGVLREILKLLSGQLSKVFHPNLERHGVGKGNRARPDDPVRVMCDGMIHNLTIDKFEYDLYLSTQPNQVVSVENTVPAALIVGDGLPKHTMVREQRFALGRALKRILDGSYLATQLGAKELSRLLAAAIQPFDPGCELVSFASGAIGELSRQVHKAIEELVLARSSDLAHAPNYEAFLRGVENSSNRVGLLMGNDLSQAVMHLCREIPEFSDKRLSSTKEIIAALSPFPVFGELLRFAVSDEYFILRGRLKYSIAD
jgi:tetratricopeptide (TPR) repeat protein